MGRSACSRGLLDRAVVFVARVSDRLMGWYIFPLYERGIPGSGENGDGKNIRLKMIPVMPGLVTVFTVYMHFSAFQVTVHSPSQREGVGGRENLDMAGVCYLSPLPTSPRWGEGSERLHRHSLQRPKVGANEFAPTAIRRYEGS